MFFLFDLMFYEQEWRKLYNKTLPKVFKTVALNTRYFFGLIVLPQSFQEIVFWPSLKELYLVIAQSYKKLREKSVSLDDSYCISLGNKQHKTDIQT